MSLDAVPVVRSILACEEIITDPRNPNRVSLINLVNSIRSLDDPPYPMRLPVLCLFAQLIECRGVGRLQAAIRVDDTDEVVYRTPEKVLTFANDPLRVYGLRFRIRLCLFPGPGLYWFELWYNERKLAAVPLTLR